MIWQEYREVGKTKKLETEGFCSLPAVLPTELHIRKTDQTGANNITTKKGDCIPVQ